MIEVKLREQDRLYTLFVGQKKIGHVRVYRNGRVAAYGVNVDGTDLFLNTHETLRQATNQILMCEGFGKSLDVTVRRSSGGRKG